MAKRRIRGPMVSWGVVLQRIMDSNEHLRTQTALSQRCGIAQSTVGRILRGEVDPQAGNLERIARAFGLSLAELDDLRHEGSSDAEPGDLAKLIERSTRVPLVSWDRVGTLADSLADSSDGPQPIDNADSMPRPKRSGAKTFALRVRGEAMEPNYQHADVIFVDPDVAAEHGKDVVVQLDREPDAVFRRLVAEGSVKFLKPLNPRWPAPVIDISAYPNARIIGVVIGKWVEM